MKISIIGSGRVGLSLGAVLANSGFSVLMTDKEDKKQEVLGKLSFYEPQLKEYLDKTQDKLEWTRWGEKLLSSDIIFFCLSFPIQKKGDLNLIELFDWIKYILDHSKGRKILVIKSTVPVGTHQKIQNIIADNKKITVVSCPEFLREGYAVHDLINPQKIVIGSSNQTAVTKLKEIYKKISKPKQIIQTTPETAELAKLAYNSFLGLKISFINEIAGFCEKVQADIDKLKLIIGSDSIREEDFLNQGLGYGGYCIPRDIETLILSAQKKHQNMDLLKIAQNINSSLVDYFFKKIKNQ
ncbi:MAG: nucleotide sugar dehydrogenase, partial [Bdellovibrionaceae bacterium]|nr:nucleotide sugar dehydrogenase [Pseudobdellovibrionaceae bacterium]